MKKRKIISGVLALSCLLGASGGNAFAVDLTGDGATGSTTVRKIVNASYTVTIPDTIDIPDYNVKTGQLIEITLNDNYHISTKKQVDISIEGYEDGGENAGAIKLEDPENEDAEIFSPLRLTAAENGGEMDAIDNLEEDKVSADDTTLIASFDYKGNNSISKKLYAYRAFTSDNGYWILDKNNPAGTYEGKINFKLTYADKTVEA